MRLIDVDLYCATICKCNRRACDRAKCPIHNAPTAYSVDKIVEELEKIKGLACRGKNCSECEYTTYCFEGEQSQQVAIDKAIEIVKQGAVADDVCEWKQTSTAKYKTSCGYKLEEYFDTKACYCKQCGKKIKVV